MKILVISQYYYPEPFKIHEICEEFVKRGNEVTVITGRPNYPDGKLIEGYNDPSRMNEIVNGVHVIRTTIPLRGDNPISLIRNYLSYPRHAKKAIKSLDEEFDIVFVYQLSPVFMIKPAIYYKKQYKKKIHVYCLDLWPESMKVLHIKENNPIFKFLKKICNRLYKQCDFISVTSPAFISYLNQVNKIDLKKLNCIPQHGEKMFLKVREYKKQPKLNITFAGNIGKAQDFDCLVKAVSHIDESYLNKLKITVIGSGSYEKELKEQIDKNNLCDVFDFVGRKKVEELIPYYNDTSLFLLSLEKNSNIGKTIPSKLQTYMSAGRGIIGSIDGATAKIIRNSNAGVVCDAGDYTNLAKIITDMIDAEDSFIERLSKNSRQYFIDNFTIDKYVNQVVKKWEELV
ncbi:glycosyltransferase family 4 protein [Thomasclavelia sp.]|uniref:glycosyltransferase family 4 protein n=1 Tax=Thomasclavelia sp. TaxID=3025757 RepID=UPI0026290404|nr:glycosyltransferase family 4 protein [Thomasclavelia sp.]